VKDAKAVTVVDGDGPGEKDKAALNRFLSNNLFVPKSNKTPDRKVPAEMNANANANVQPDQFTFCLAGDPIIGHQLG
jgi:hypothetical protein